MTRAIVVAIALACAAGPAAADTGDEPPPEIKELVARAQNHFDLGEYDDAISDFRKAYMMEPRPGLLYNLGQAYRLKGDCVTAARMYRNFLRLDPDSKYRDLAERQLTEIADCEREQRDAGAHSAPLEGVDEEPAPPPPDPVSPEPAVVASSPAAEEPPPPPPARRGRALKRGGIYTAAGGAVLLAAGGYFAFDATRAAGEVSDAYRDGGDWADLEAIDARGRRAEVAGTTLMVVGAAAVVTGASLYFLGWRLDRHVVVIPRREGAEVGVAWQF